MPQAVPSPATTSAQMAVSSVLTAMRLNFTSSIDADSDARFWTVSLLAREGGPETFLTLFVAQNIYSVAALIRCEGLDPSELHWKITERIPFCRVVRDATSDGRVWLRCDMPVDRNSPHILPDTIRVGVEVVFTAATFLVDEYPGRVHPEHSSTVPFRTFGEASTSGQKAPEQT